ncbi:translocation/assembly module TamB domain-containing protein [Uliginosibacterium sp. sgz301328]|uniref:translocation/assembly module TamB domain-containing protein n=1 Tax=Uliginosibacterium sp. sgz301328 TaxID=3243764 RepID=UPI00359CD505
MSEEPSTEPSQEETPKTPTPAPRRFRPWRWLRHALVTCVAIVLLACAALAWVVGTETGGRVGLNMASNVLGGIFKVDGWKGRLLDQWQVDRFELRLAHFRLVATNADVSWRLPPLLSADIQLQWLRVGSLDIRTAPSEPATPSTGAPRDVLLPVAIHAQEVKVGTLTIGQLVDTQTQPDPYLKLTDIVGQVDSDAERHIVDQLAVTTPAGRVTGNARMGTVSPFPLLVQATLAGTLDARAMTVNARAEGTLLQPHVVARVEGDGVEGDADIAAQPFEPVPLQRARLSFRNLDPASFHPQAPHARLDISADLTPSIDPAATATGVAAWRVAGPIDIANKEPGGADHGRIPVERLTSALTWSAGLLTADRLRIEVPGRGVVSGVVSWRPAKDDVMGRIEGRLQLSNVDPSRIYSTLAPMRVSGDASAVARSDDQTFNVRLTSDRFRLTAQGEQRAGVLRLSRAELAHGTSAVAVSGQMALRGTQQFSVQGTTAHFDPRQWVTTAPQGDLNIKFALNGQVSPTWQARAEIDLGDSRLAGRALSGGGRVAAAPGRIVDADLNINVLENTLLLKGAFGRAGDLLQYSLDARHLNRLGEGLGGVATIEGTLGGSLENPSGKVQAQVQNLVLPGAVRIDRGTLTASMQDGLDGIFQGKLDVGSVRVGANDEPYLRSATASIDGLRKAHTFSLAADLMRDEKMQLRTRGGFVDGMFKGKLEQFEASGPVTFALAGPVDLTASATHVVLAAARLKAQNGSVQLTQTEWSPHKVIARGSISGVEIGLVEPDDGSRTPRSERRRARTLKLGGSWDVSLSDNSTGLIKVFREGGDIILQGDTPVALGVDSLEATLALQDNRLTFNALANGTRLGNITLVGSAATRGSGSRIQLDDQMPLVGVGHVTIPALDWVGPFIDPNLRTAGSLNGQFNVLGTPAEPRGEGNLKGDKLEIGLADQGMRLTDGSLLLSFDASQVKLESLRFTSQNQVPAPDARLRVLNLNRPGGINGTGALQLATGKGAFRIDVDRVGVAQQPNQWILLSGTTTIDTGWDSFNLNAKLRADGGFVGAPRANAPSLSDDVVVRGRQREERGMRLNAEVAFDFGDQFILRAYGINTFLDGVLRLRLVAGEPMRATGSIRARDGVYEGFGQRLAIDRGVVNFQGPIDNPGLNVVALRTGLQVEAGVEITGTARSPRVRLVSRPNVPESEKLSWMLLGRASDPGTGDAGLLLSVAGAAMGGEGGEGPIEKILHGLGLDDINLSQSSSTERPLQSQVASNATGLGSSVGASTDSANQVLVLGKRISPRAHLSFEQNFIGTESVVRLTYTLTRYLSLIARAGTDNALDLNYTIVFR